MKESKNNGAIKNKNKCSSYHVSVFQAKNTEMNE